MYLFCSVELPTTRQRFNFSYFYRGIFYIFHFCYIIIILCGSVKMSKVAGSPSPPQPSIRTRRAQSSLRILDAKRPIQIIFFRPSVVTASLLNCSSALFLFLIEISKCSIKSLLNRQWYIFFPFYARLIFWLFKINSLNSN